MCDGKLPILVPNSKFVNGEEIAYLILIRYINIIYIVHDIMHVIGGLS